MPRVENVFVELSFRTGDSLSNRYFVKGELAELQKVSKKNVTWLVIKTLEKHSPFTSLISLISSISAGFVSYSANT